MRTGVPAMALKTGVCGSLPGVSVFEKPAERSIWLRVWFEGTVKRLVIGSAL